MCSQLYLKNLGYKEFDSDLVSVQRGSCDFIGVLKLDIELEVNISDLCHVEVQDFLRVCSICGSVRVQIDFNQLIYYLGVISSLS